MTNAGDGHLEKLLDLATDRFTSSKLKVNALPAPVVLARQNYKGLLNTLISGAPPETL